MKNNTFKRVVWNPISLLIVLAFIGLACETTNTTPPSSGSNPPGEAILLPDDPNNIPDQLVTTVDNSPYTDLIACLASAEASDAEYFECNVAPDGIDLAMIPVAMLTTLTPGPADNAIPYGIITAKNGLKYIVTGLGAYYAGVQAAKNWDPNSDGSVDLGTFVWAEAVGGYIPVDPAHDTSHDIVNNLPQTQAMLERYQDWTATGGPNDPNFSRRFLCTVLKIGGQIVRYSLWNNKGSVLLVWHAAPPAGVDPWVTIFGPKGGGSLLNVPGDIKEKYPDAAMESIDCNQLPPFPPLPAG